MSSQHRNSRNRKRARAKKQKIDAAEASTTARRRSTESCSLQAQEQQQQQIQQPESKEEAPQQEFHHRAQKPNDPPSLKPSSLDQDEEEPLSVTTCPLDPVQCVIALIPNKIFSYLNQKDCLKAMGVSKLWMERVPIFCINAWREVELDEVAHDLENTLVHRCLGSHVAMLAFGRFSQQSRLLKMMRIARARSCTDQIEIVYNECRITDLKVFLDHFQPLTKNVIRLAFLRHGDPLSISRIMPVCPNLQQLALAFKDKTQSMVPMPHPSSHHLPLSNNSATYALTNLEIFIMLSLTTLLHPRRSGRNSGLNISCSSKELAAVITHCPRLERLALHSTGDNLDPIVIDAISKLPVLRDLELHYDNKRPPNHLDGTLYFLLSKHGNLGSASPLRRLSLNVADDMTLLLIGKIVTLKNIYLVNTFYNDNAFNPISLIRFAELLADSSSVQSLTLHQFDLRSRMIMYLFTHIASLNVVDFTDCQLDRESYLYFLNNAASLTHVRQPNCEWDALLTGPFEEVPLVDDSGNRLIFTVVNVERMPMSFLFNWRTQRNAHVVVVVTSYQQFLRYFSLIVGR